MINETEKVETETTKKDSEGVETEEVENTESEEETTTEPEKSEIVVETPEAKRARLERQLKQHNKKYGFEQAEKPNPKAKKSDEFDEGQLAYLVTKGIDSDEDIDFTKGELKKHGGTLRELLSNEYFKAEMAKRKDAKAALEATPSNSRRTSSRPNDAVEYEYAKYMKTGKLPADREMREKLVNMRLKKEASNNQFTDTPVIGA